MAVTMNSTSTAGMASRRRASKGALRLPVRAGGVWGRVSEKAARARETPPAIQKMEVSACWSAAPSTPFRRKKKGQLAAIQPMVPHRRTRPNCCPSFRWWKQMEFVTDMVGTYMRLCTSMPTKKGQNVRAKASEIMASPPTRWERARKRSLGR
jgi:hypothetical protein